MISDPLDFLIGLAAIVFVLLYYAQQYDKRMHQDEKKISLNW